MVPRARASISFADASRRTVAGERDMSSPVSSVVVCMAMEQEAAPLIERLGLQPQPPFAAPAPFVAHAGEYKGLQITVVTSGKDAATGVNNIGTAPAALGAYLALERLKPDLLLNAGTCGGFKAEGGAIGSVYVVSEFRNHDRRISIPGFAEYGAARAARAAPAVTAALGAATGAVSSGNSLDICPEDLAALQASHACCKDMEASGIAWAASFFPQTPLVAIKVVTDIVDGDKPSHEEFLENLATAAQSLQKTVPAALDFIAGKPLDAVFG